jgi:MFS family permease
MTARGTATVAGGAHGRGGSGSFRRDRLTRTLYGAYITWGWFLYAFSPTVPLIAAEEGVSRGLAGLHGTALALGAVISGFLTPVLAGRFGRRVVHLVGSAFLLLGTAALMIGTTLPATLTACLVLAIGGNLTLTSVQPALIVHHGVAGPAAVTEGTGLGSGVGLLAPLAVGLTIGLGWGWRPAVAFTAVLTVVGAVAMATLRGEPSMERPTRVAPAERTRPARYPTALWFFLVAMVCAVAVEFSTAFWAPDLLVARTGASAPVSTAAVSGLIAGMTLARFVVGPLVVRKAPEKILLVGFAVAGLGWAVFWLATSPVVAVIGLVVAGLGYGTHYPLSVSLVLRAAGARPDHAQGIASLGVGGAVGLAPFLLGAAADAFGTHRAFLLVGFLIACGGTAVALGLRAVHRELRRAAAATRPRTDTPRTDTH